MAQPLYDLFILWLILRWNGNGAAWDDRHRLALIVGALSFFLLLGPLTSGNPVMVWSNPFFFLLLLLSYGVVARRTAAAVGA